MLTLSRTQLGLAAALIASVSFWGGSTAEGFIPFAAANPIYDVRAPAAVDLAPLFTAWRLLDENFVVASTTASTTPAEERLWGAIQGLTQTYGDEYTVFFPPVQKELFETEVRGDFEGVGMEIGIRDDILTVIAPIKGTPASRAGVLSGDLILEIDGQSTKGLAVDEAVARIRGEKGTSVQLLMSRSTKDSGAPFTVSIVRDRIVLPTIEASYRSDGIFVIQLFSFNAQAAQLFAQSMTAFEASGSKKLIIDLRNNPGGYLEAAVDIAGWFLPQGAVVVREDYGTKRSEDIFRSGGYRGAEGVEIVVLVNGGSASASEILAGALQDHNRATIVGEQSFGKGSVQQVFDVTDTTSLKITIARWLTPNGTTISGTGITPDIEVGLSEEDRTLARDPQLERAVEYLLTGK